LTTALVDGDIVAFRALTGSSKSIDWGDGLGTEPTVSVPDAVDAACGMIEAWASMSRYGMARRPPIVCCSGRTGANFRKVLAPTIYKTSRGEKPPGYWEVVEGIEKRFKFFRVEGIEADDLMGIAGTDRDRFGDTVIVSLDKDMRTIPAWVFNPTKDNRPQRISVQRADHFWMTQTLTGTPWMGTRVARRLVP